MVGRPARLAGNSIACHVRAELAARAVGEVQPQRLRYGAEGQLLPGNLGAP